MHSTSASQGSTVDRTSAQHCKSCPPHGGAEGPAAAYAEAICRFQQYLAAYNAQDLDQILDTHLSDACEVIVDGRAVLAGKDAIKPTYLNDWSHADFCSKPVTVVGQPEAHVGTDGTTVVVDVTLHKATDDVFVSLSYVFEMDQQHALGRMVRHCVHRVWKQ